MIKIIKEKSLWNTALKEVGYSDFYHTFDYHQITKNDGDLPILIVYEEGETRILLPLLIREIKGTSFYDATSVYGYAGPLTQNVAPTFDNTNFRQELERLFHQNSIVSVFSRLNPFIPNQESCLSGLGEISTMGKVVNIDITQDLDTQRKQYQKRLRTYVNKCRNQYRIQKAETDAEISTFIEMYYANMYRVGAKKHYFFKRDYFFDLLKSDRFEASILLAIDTKTEAIIGGAMFVKKNKIVQYHLSGVKEEYLHLNPVKLLIDEMRIRSTSDNCSYFNLGGGLGSKEDTLFQFKAGFSMDFKYFKLWKYIVNEAVYEDLVSKKTKKTCGRFTKNCPDYFPCYRCNPQV